MAMEKQEAEGDGRSAEDVLYFFFLFFCLSFSFGSFRGF
jgi:hypothetical protein